ncbi:MAG: NADH-quinone oxidoreductase subunit C [Methanomicrobiales archaeon]|nr:NADH-quinone oxidoreductase subunit C [Methanomicrobiales archaeon]
MKIEEQTTTEIEVANLIGKVQAYRSGGYRLVQVTCSKVGDLFEINYSFEKDLRFENVRIIIDPDTEVPSISGMYWGAFVYENEMHDLFGVQVKGMNVDFHGNFIRTAVPYPFRTQVFKGEGPCHDRS